MAAAIAVRCWSSIVSEAPTVSAPYSILESPAVLAQMPASTPDSLRLTTRAGLISVPLSRDLSNFADRLAPAVVDVPSIFVSGLCDTFPCLALLAMLSPCLRVLETTTDLAADTSRFRSFSSLSIT